MDNWIGINELADKYIGRLNPKYKFINRIGTVLFLIGVITGIICLILSKWNDWIHIGFASKMVVFIILNIIAQMCVLVGIAILFFYGFWNIVLKAMDGFKQATFIVLLPILMLITVIAIPTSYIPVVSNLVHIDGHSLFITDDLSYAWACLTDKGVIESKEIFLDDCIFGTDEKLYGYIRIQNKKLILPYDDYLKIKNNHDSFLLCQYNSITNIIVQYEIYNESTGDV